MGSKPIGISGSRSASILGMSPYQTKLEVWLIMMEQIEPGFCEKHGYILPIVEYNSAMKWGHAFESAIIELAEQKMGIDIAGRETYYNKDYITCHIDGHYVETDFLHEGKTTSIYYYRDNFGEPGTDKVPQEYQLQCQHQLICTGAENVILSVLVFPKRVEEFEAIGLIPSFMENGEYCINIDKKYDNNTWILPEIWARTLADMGYFHQYEIRPHAELQKLMLSEYEKFWKKNILEKIPPEPETLDDFKRLVRSPVGTIIADENIERWVTEKNNIQDEIKSAENRVEQIKLDVLKYCESAVKTEDDDTTDKWIIRGRDGKKLGQYSKDKNGNMIFR